MALDVDPLDPTREPGRLFGMRKRFYGVMQGNDGDDTDDADAERRDLSRRAVLDPGSARRERLVARAARPRMARPS